MLNLLRGSNYNRSPVKEKWKSKIFVSLLGSSTFSTPELNISFRGSLFFKYTVDSKDIGLVNRSNSYMYIVLLVLHLYLQRFHVRNIHFSEVSILYIASSSEYLWSFFTRALDKREYLMIIFLISHRNHML